ncbi:DUF3168 domain-containing protein [uncultured Parasphingorhabdus sp.]|uniref:DUF3168 domain-containing protein n=1 Tax=uncultured Parasphingorhabdus sp. TaxID=2709694 RepID=UPI002AA7C180|nr:DUF3168 domain-containing protein [uncultured Parasphingorhabdus sp.]
MSSALEAVQQQLVAQLDGNGALMDLVSGIFDGPPPRAAFPYIALATGASLDWSHKSGTGRELSLALTIHDDGETAARLHRVMALVEQALEPGLDDPAGWQIVTFDFRRTRILRSAVSPWNGLIEYRTRVLRA